ncbi:MAG: SufE family protein [Bdellovibrionales bacterium]|nr:SufE family protein [Bdellovibrionales bacterium]
MTESQKRQKTLVDEFSQCKDWESRYKKIIAMGKSLEKLDESLYQEKFLVKGCQSQVWLHAHLDSHGKVILQADSDALIVKGLVSLLLNIYSGLTPDEILSTSPDFIKELGFQKHLSPSRANGFLSMIKQIMLYAQAFKMQESL